MSLDLKPYPAYKDSGEKWLGQVPEQWDVVPLYAVAKPKSIAGKQDRELLSVYLDRGVIRFSDVEAKRTNVTSEDLSKYQAVDPGDFVLNNQQAWRGSVGVSAHTGIVSPAYLVLSLESKFQPEFANLLFRERAMVSQYLICSKGVGSIQRNLYWPYLKRASTVAPPLVEQDAIVRFLDYMDARIRRYVRAKQKLIKLLDEQKQAIIDQAVTGQIDVRTGKPYPAYKDPGVEWLERVPKHWSSSPLKHWVKMNGAVLPETTSPSYEFRYIDIGSVGTGVLSERPVRICFANAPSRARRMTRRDDTIVSTVRTYLRAVYFIDEDIEDLVCSTGFAVLTPRTGVVPKFVRYVVQSRSFTDRVAASSVGIAYPAIAETRLGSLHVATPPPPEQAAIVRFLEDATPGADSAIAHAQHEIALLREYRTRLIADVVTGKLDVRKAAANLPDEAEQPEPLADEDLLADDSEVGETVQKEAALEEVEV